MAIKTKAELKAKFENGDKPDEQAFIDLFDSLAHVNDLPSNPNGIEHTAEIGDGPVVVIPVTRVMNVSICDKDGYLEIITPQFVPFDNPTECRIDFGEVLTEQKKIYLN